MRDLYARFVLWLIRPALDRRSRITAIFDLSQEPTSPPKRRGRLVRGMWVDEADTVTRPGPACAGGDEA